MADNDRGILGVYRSAYRPTPSHGYEDYPDPRGNTLGDLIGRRGRLQAERHISGSNLLADAVQQAGSAVAGYFADRDQKQTLAKREAATLAAIEGWDGQDPMALFGAMQKVRGPSDALQYTNAVLSLRKGPQKDPEAELSRFGKVAQFLGDQPDEVVSRAWPHVLQSLGSTASKLGLEDPSGKWDPQFRPLIQKAGEVFGPKRETRKVGTLSPGQVAFDEASGEIVAKGAEKPAERRVSTLSPGAMAFDEATGEVVARAPAAPREPKEEPLVQIDVNGIPTWVPRSQAVGRPAAQAARTPTGSERQALAYYNRGRQALEDIAPLEKEIQGKDLVGQARLQFAPNWLQSQENQRYRQAQRAFTEARLRKESGAAIPASEFENDSKTYFAQPGDTPQVLAQKKTAREKVLEGLGYSSGKAYQEFYGGPMERSGIRPIPDKPKGPKSGEVVRGYRYLGGDPSKPESWQRVR